VLRGDRKHRRGDDDVPVFDGTQQHRDDRSREDRTVGHDPLPPAQPDNRHVHERCRTDRNAKARQDLARILARNAERQQRGEDCDEQPFWSADEPLQLAQRHALGQRWMPCHVAFTAGTSRIRSSRSIPMRA
jgi:hypothetical protein